MTGFSNPIVGGGGALVYPSIHSPNFVHLVSGWTIDKDGSAEFGNLIVRGSFSGTDYVLNNAGAFWYSGTPAAGNLIVAIANAAGADPFGNAYATGISVLAGAIDGGQVNSGTISTAQLAALAVTASKIAANTITTSQIAAAAGILGAQIAAATITGSNLVANTVTAAQIAANTITAAQIAAATITAGQIAAGTITGSNIAAGTITAANILAATITAAQIAAGTITAAKLAAGIVVAGIVDATTITGAHFVAEGTAGEYLAYSGTPAAGNLIMAFSPSGGTDSFGNVYLAGLYVAQAAPLTDFVEINNGQITLGNGAGTNATVFGFGGELNLNSGKTATPGDTAANIVLYSADTGSRAQVIVSPAGASPAPVTGALLEVQGQMTATSAAVSGAASVSGVAALDGGSDTSGSAAVTTPGFANGIPSQLADTTHDHMVYLQIGTAGTAFSLKIGAGNPPGNNIYVSATPPAGMLISFRLPAGWFVEWAGTSTTIAMQRAVVC